MPSFDVSAGDGSGSGDERAEARCIRVLDEDSKAADKPSQPKLTAKQKQAVDILEMVQGELGRYSPEVQTYLLMQMAEAYRQIDRPKQVELLKEAFQSAANISDDHYRTQQQTDIVKELNQADPSALVSMQDSPDPKVREVVLRLLVKQDIDRGKLEAAAQRLSQWDPSLQFPYEYASRPSTSSPRNKRVSVSLCLRQPLRPTETVKWTLSARGALRISFWVRTRKCLRRWLWMPSTWSSAKSRRWNQASQEHMSISSRGKNGNASFSSLYDFELFELLPVLNKLDRAKADALRRDHATVAALNDKYPNGRLSLNPDGKDLGTMYSSSRGDDPPTPPNPEFTQQRQTADTIAESSSKSVDAAIANAQGLSNTVGANLGPMTLRCNTLEKIGSAAWGGRITRARLRRRRLWPPRRSCPAGASALPVGSGGDQCRGA